KDALVLKPLGDLFINAMFMVVVPLGCTTRCSAGASMSAMERLGKVMRSLVVVFLITGALAAILMLVTVTIFPPAQGANIQMQTASKTLSTRLG
ncbi:cation:dicarboxylate symporter family transporter, partial [Cloacibacillus evryensis]|uniref:cation:dicarboxylate symporter family transporter n=1 Tax=Cloacibacillus evryensis TaxID=508460 RepID=UPI00210991E3